MTVSVTTTFYLIRHGEVNNSSKLFYGRSRDIPLNQEGVKQAQAIGKHLIGKNISVIYSSPLLRTKQTANQISQTLGGITVVLSDKLLEVESYGFEGVSISELVSLGDYYKNIPKGITIEKT